MRSEAPSARRGWAVLRDGSQVLYLTTDSGPWALWVSPSLGRPELGERVYLLLTGALSALAPFFLCLLELVQRGPVAVAMNLRGKDFENVSGLPVAPRVGKPASFKSHPPAQMP